MAQPHPTYELFEEIGRGENSVVYRAHDITLGRSVAIKELNDTGRADATRRQRFLKEAQFLAQHQHPGILCIHGVDTERGWIVMELMRGTLEAQIQQAPLPADAVRSILRQLLPALDFLHSRNKIHGSIRPSNILIDERGTVKLSDFEETHVDSELRAPTHSQKYISPEMIRSEFGELGTTTDLYCLAFTALELLAGPKFDALTVDAMGASVDRNVAWLRWHSGEQANPSVQDILPNLPQDLVLTLDAMLRKEVSLRCATAADALKTLNDQALVHVAPIAVAMPKHASPSIMPTNVREIEPIASPSRSPSAAPNPDAKKGRGASQRKSAKPLVAAGRGNAVTASKSSRDRANELLGKWYVLYPLCAALLLGAVGIGWMLQPKQTDPLAQSPDRRSTLRVESLPEALPEALAKSPSRESTADKLEREALDRTVIPPVETPPEPLKPDEPEPEVTPAVEPVAEVQDPDSLVINTPEKPEPQTTEPEGDQPQPTIIDEPNVDFNRQLLELVSVAVDTQPLMQEFKGKAELIIDGGGFMSEVTDLAISPDGLWLAASGEKVVRIWDLNSGQLMHTLRGDRNRVSYGDCYSIAFSPDGTYLVVGVNDYREHGAIRVYRTDKLDEIDQLLPGHNVPVRHVAFTRDGKQLASVDADGFIAVWDWDSRKVVKRLPPRNAEAPIYDALQFPGKEPVLFGVDFGGPVLYSAPSLVAPQPDALASPLRAWMIDIFGRKFSYPFGATRDPRILDLRMDQNVWAAAGVGNEDGGNKFWVGVWPTHATEAPSVPAPTTVYDQHRWNVTALCLAPEQGWVASGDRFGEIHVWELKTGKQLHKFVGQGKPIYEAAFDRNSQRIAFGTTPFQPDRWGSNNYGQAEQLIDLAARTVYPIPSDETVDLIGELPKQGQVELKVRQASDQSALRLQKLVAGNNASEYELTSGRLPTVFSIIGRSVLDVTEPVLLGDDLGLLAVWDSETDELKRAFVGHEGLVSAVSVSPDKQLMLSSSADRTIRLWSLEDYRPTGIFDFKFENSKVTRVMPGTSSAAAGVEVGDRILTIDGKSMKDMYELMLQGEFDYRPGQEVEVEMQRDEKPFRFTMKLKDGYDFSEPILSVYLGEDNSWIIWNPQGYYDCSPGADQLIGWHINRGPDKSANYYEVQQFRKQLYRPDVINYLLEGKSLKASVALADQDNLREGEFDFRSPSDLAAHHPPVVEFVSPQRDSQSMAHSENEQVPLHARVKSVNGLPIREVTLLVNGVAAQVFTPDSPNAQEFELQQTLSLTSGQNEIALIAANSESTSAAETLRIDIVKPVKVEAKNLIVLAIGISNYATDDQRFNLLTTAARDAQQFADTAVVQGSSRLYNDVRTRVIQDAGADKTKFWEGMQWLVDSTQPGDTAAIFISAYCLLDSTSNFYVGTHDVDMRSPRATAVSWREFIKTLHEDLPSCRRLVFLDLQPTQQAIAPGLRNPLLDLAAPELATTFFSSTALQQTRITQPAQERSGALIEALVRTLADPASDFEPQPTDTLLSNFEVSKAWQSQFKKLTDGKLVPVAYVPTSSRQLNVFQLKP